MSELGFLGLEDIRISVRINQGSNLLILSSLNPRNPNPFPFIVLLILID